MAAPAVQTAAHVLTAPGCDSRTLLCWCCANITCVWRGLWPATIAAWLLLASAASVVVGWLAGRLVGQQPGKLACLGSDGGGGGSRPLCMATAYACWPLHKRQAACFAVLGCLRSSGLCAALCLLQPALMAARQHGKDSHTCCSCCCLSPSPACCACAVQWCSGSRCAAMRRCRPAHSRTACCFCCFCSQQLCSCSC